MSQTVAPQRPTTPPPQRRNGPQLQPNARRDSVLPAKLDAWRVAFFRNQGWKAKAEDQTEMFDEMQVYCESMEADILPADPAVNPYVAENLDEKKLKAGKEFKAYIAALKAFEGTEVPRDPLVVGALRQAAQGYLDHYAEHSKSKQKEKINVYKATCCRTTLAQLKKYEVRDQMDALGPPPWDSARAMQAASLKATLDLESLPQGKQAEELGGNHAFPAFWISQEVGSVDEPVKTFLFKPATTEKASGIPPGGTAPREAAANRAADLIGAMTGLGFDVPETNIISMSKSRLPEGRLDGVIGGDDPARPDVVGSLQKVAENQGGLRGQSLAAREAMPAEEIQKIILLDMAVLNLDRHADNMLAQQQPDGSTRLIPIDHGLSMPGYAAAKDGTIADKLGNPNFTATLAMPGAHEKFTPAALDAINKLQPDIFAKAMKAEIAAIGQAHPSTQGQITDESVEMSRRSMMFLKLGAPKLTAAALQVFFGQNAKALLDPAIDDREFMKRALLVIDQATAQQEGLRAFMQMAPDERPAIIDRLKANGWEMKDDEWVLANPQAALAYYHGNILHPGKLAAVEQRLGKPAAADWLKTMSLQALFQDLDTIAGGKRVLMDDIAKAEMTQLLQDFPGHVPFPGREGDSIAAWRKLVQLGGTNEVERAIQILALPNSEQKGVRTSPSLALELVELTAGFVALSDDDRQRLEECKAAFPEPQVPDGNLRITLQTLAKWDEFLRLGGLLPYQLALDGLKQPRSVNLDQAIASLKAFDSFVPADQQMLARIDDLRREFPGEASYDENPRAAVAAAAAWGQLQGLGGVNALDELLAKTVGGAQRPKLATQAVDLLKAADAYDKANAAAAQLDLATPALATELAYVQSLLPRLANGSAVPAKLTQFAQNTPQDAALAKKALHALKLEAMDEILAALRLRIKAVDKRIEKYRPIADAKGLQPNSTRKEDGEIDFIAEDFTLPQANILAGVLGGAEAKLNEFAQRLDDWRDQQNPNPG